MHEITHAVSQANQEKPLISSFGLLMIRFNSIILAVPCVWYLGWAGLMVALLGYFDFFHALIGWILLIPYLFLDARKQDIFDYTCAALLVPINIIAIIFSTVSFFVVDFKYLFEYITDSKRYIIILIILLFDNKK